MKNAQVVDVKLRVMELPDTVATRKYPFTQDTLDKIRELRVHYEDRVYDSSGDVVTVPAPVIIADAIDMLHNQVFNKE